MKLYIWGTGCGAGDLADHGLDESQVCAFLDSAPVSDCFLGRPVLRPEAVGNEKIDLILVANRHVEEIAQKAAELGIAADKLIFLKNNWQLCDRNRDYTAAEKILDQSYLDSVRAPQHAVREPLWVQGSPLSPRDLENDYVRTRTLEAICRELEDVPGAAAELASEFLPAVKLGLHKMAQSARNSEANSFMHLNFDSVSASNPFDVEVSYADLKIADGKLPEVSFAAPSFEETNSIQCAFIGNVEAEGADSSDSVYIFAYSPELGKGLLSAPVSRSEQSITLNTPLGWNGTTVHVYGFTVNGTGVASDSCYVGSGSIN